jgi:hypothetical protein
LRFGGDHGPYRPCLLPTIHLSKNGLPLCLGPLRAVLPHDPGALGSTPSNSLRRANESCRAYCSLRSSICVPLALRHRTPPCRSTMGAGHRQNIMSTGVGPQVTEVTGGSKPDGLGCLHRSRERTGFSHTRSAFHPLPVHPRAIVSLEAPVTGLLCPKAEPTIQGGSRVSAVSTDPRTRLYVSRSLRFPDSHRSANAEAQTVRFSESSIAA